MDTLRILRIYSLVDLVLLLWAVGREPPTRCIGAVCLWVGFLFYLEWRHAHAYRPKVREVEWLVPGMLGTLLFPAHLAIGYAVLCSAYAHKDRGWWAMFSPLVRGLQTTIVVVGVGGSFRTALMTGGIIGVRNLLGDVRDADKDRDEGMRTIPVVLGLRTGVPHIHLVAILVTTLIWSKTLANLPWCLVVAVWLVQIATYNLTPR